jgi:glycerol-3-phosphate dehydrogenase (NAD(P)+)
MRIAVIGAGSWGTTMATLAARRHPTALWARRPELAEAIRQGENPDYLPGYRLPYGLDATSDIIAAVDGAEVILMAVPSHGYRAVIEQIAGTAEPETPILSLTKGIEQATLKRMTEITLEVLDAHDPHLVGVLTGPNLAKEIMDGMPTATVIAMRDMETAAVLQRVFMGPTFRVYTNPDVVGCETAGALKNVMAIAAGMSSGLGFGDNSLATLITRALAELTRLGVAMGGSPQTFAGLAGMGDLIATCISDKSRNHRVGFELGRGRSLDEIVGETQRVAEGVKTTRAVLELADRFGVEMPIATEVAKVLYEGERPKAAVLNLMTRQAKPET